VLFGQGRDVKKGRRFRRPKPGRFIGGELKWCVRVQDRKALVGLVPVKQEEPPCLVVLAVGFVAGPALTAAVEPAAIFPVYSDLFTVIVEIAC
jgi:hypothetical protein